LAVSGRFELGTCQIRSKNANRSAARFGHETPGSVKCSRPGCDSGLLRNYVTLSTTYCSQVSEFRGCMLFNEMGI
jgi:hypothetical protein